MDKSSILEEAIKYIKQLQEEEKKFEVLSRERAAESRVIMKKAEIFEVGDEISDVTMEDSLPEVEARVCGKNVLIRIHCQKQKGALTKALTELEKLNVTVINSIALPFGDLTLDITIIAQVAFKSERFLYSFISRIMNIVVDIRDNKDKNDFI